MNNKPIIYAAKVCGQYVTTTATTTADKLRTVEPILNKPEDERTPFERATLLNAMYFVTHKDTASRNSKLDSLISISTCALTNPFCAKLRTVAGCICQKCYATAQQKQQTALAEHNTINGLILCNQLFTVEELATKYIGVKFARIEAFGDVYDLKQAQNYIRLIKSHPETIWGIWTKHPATYDAAFTAEGGKPRNARFVLSSRMINQQTNTPDYISPDMIDHVFTVYDRKTPRPEAAYHCRKKCRECIVAGKGCYYPASEFNPVQVAEEIK